MRPEHENPPEIYYGVDEARKYTKNTRIQEVQVEMADRAIELLGLPDDEDFCGLILDIGCGSGLSGEVLEEYGHHWVGFDISPSMLEVAREREVEGDLFLQDAGQGMSFRPGSFDGAISISCIQWLCNQDYKSHNPRKRLLRFFGSLYESLKHGARAIFQFYPENASQIELITSTAMQAGFSGGLTIDYPNSSKRKKYFLCLFAGVSSDKVQIPRGLSDDMDIEEEESMVEMGGQSIQFGNRQRNPTKQNRNKKRGAKEKDIDWILRKKESRRKKGLKVASDSKFTGRKRKSRMF